MPADGRDARRSTVFFIVKSEGLQFVIKNGVHSAGTNPISVVIACKKSFQTRSS